LRIPQAHAVKHGPHHHRAEETLRRRSTQGTGMATPVETEAVETETLGESKEVTEAEEAMAGLVVKTVVEAVTVVTVEPEEALAVEALSRT
jgi:hypothetical protein